MQIIEHANTLRALLDQDHLDAEDETLHYKGKTQNLTYRDSWRANGIVDDLEDWTNSEEAPVFWASGSCGPNHDSWVTPFSLDIIEAMRSQTAASTSVLCDSHATMTPHLLCRHLICRTLDQIPTLILQDPRIFNARKFRAAAAAASYISLWNIFEELIMRADSMFIVIDRVDRIFEVEDAEGQVEAGDFITKLLKLAQKSPDMVRFIITSIDEPINYIDDDDTISAVQGSYINTGRRPGQRRD